MSLGAWHGLDDPGSIGISLCEQNVRADKPAACCWSPGPTGIDCCGIKP